MPQTIDLNCDMGEGMETDAMMMPFISSANIACGYHAGDAESLKKTVILCLENKVAAGPHPSFFDLENFGRKDKFLSDGQVYDLITDQLQFFEKIAFPMGCIMHHVKPHGALYNMAARDKHLSSIIAKAICDFDDSLIVYGLSGSHLISQAAALGLKAANEIFADRSYQVDGSLTPRSQPGAMIEDEEKAVQQVMQIINHKTVITQAGTALPIEADTICIHGDGVHAVRFAHTMHQYLKARHIEIKAI